MSEPIIRQKISNNNSLLFSYIINRPIIFDISHFISGTKSEKSTVYLRLFLGEK